MNKDLTEIILVLDKSGSMGTVRNDTVGGVNTFIKDQKEMPGEAVFTFVTFDTDYNFVEQGTLMENVKEISNETYMPGGATSLFDAIGKTINDVVSRHSTLPEDEKPGKVMLVVLTDGEENSSKEFKDVKDIQKMIKEREEAGWEVLFLGADIDAWAQGGSYGFTKNISANKNDMLNNMSKMSYFTATYRSGSDVNIGEFDLSAQEISSKMNSLKKKK